MLNKQQWPVLQAKLIVIMAKKDIIAATRDLFLITAH